MFLGIGKRPYLSAFYNYDLQHEPLIEAEISEIESAYRLLAERIGNLPTNRHSMMALTALEDSKLRAVLALQITVKEKNNV